MNNQHHYNDSLDALRAKAEGAQIARERAVVSPTSAPKPHIRETVANLVRCVEVLESRLGIGGLSKKEEKLRGLNNLIGAMTEITDELLDVGERLAHCVSFVDQLGHVIGNQ